MFQNPIRRTRDDKHEHSIPRLGTDLADLHIATPMLSFKINILHWFLVFLILIPDNQFY